MLYEVITLGQRRALRLSPEVPALERHAVAEGEPVLAHVGVGDPVRTQAIAIDLIRNNFV